jgi:hypothetical protein
MTEEQQHDLDPEDLQILAMFERRPGSTLTGRRARERRPLTSSDRRVLSADHVKNLQLNLTVSAIFKRRLRELADAEGVSMIGYIERAVDHYAQRRGARS